MNPDKAVCKRCEFFKEHTCSLVNVSKALASLISKKIMENESIDAQEIFSSEIKTDKIKVFLVPENCPFYLEHLLTDKK